MVMNLVCVRFHGHEFGILIHGIYWLFMATSWLFEHFMAHGLCPVSGFFHGFYVHGFFMGNSWDCLQ
jgi:hypothetical protein